MASYSEAKRMGADECELYWYRYFKELGYEVIYLGGNFPGCDMIALRVKCDSKGNVIEVTEAIFIEVKSGPKAHLSRSQRELAKEIMNNPVIRIDRQKTKTFYAICRCDYDSHGRYIPLKCEMMPVKLD